MLVAKLFCIPYLAAPDFHFKQANSVKGKTQGSGRLTGQGGHALDQRTLELSEATRVHHGYTSHFLTLPSWWKIRSPGL